MAVKTKTHKDKPRRWDAILVIIGMTIAFCVIMMKISGIWPCEIIEFVGIQDNSCHKTLEQNINGIIDWVFKKFNF